LTPKAVRLDDLERQNKAVFAIDQRFLGKDEFGRTVTVDVSVCLSHVSILRSKTSNLSKAYETRNSLTCSYSQIVLVYLQPLSRNSPLKCAPQPKIVLEPPILAGSRSSMSILLKSSSSVLVMTNSISMPICNCFHVRRANIGKIIYFLEGCSALTLACAGLLEHTGSAHGLLKPAFNAENFILQVVLIYLKPFRRKSRLKCALQPKIAKN